MAFEWRVSNRSEANDEREKIEQEELNIFVVPIKPNTIVTSQR